MWRCKEKRFNAFTPFIVQKCTSRKDLLTAAEHANECCRSILLKMVCSSVEPFPKSIRITLQAISLLSVQIQILSSKTRTLVDSMVDPDPFIFKFA